MKREELRQIGIKDRTGKEIVVGDIFEYENLYIVTLLISLFLFLSIETY